MLSSNFMYLASLSCHSDWLSSLSRENPKQLKNPPNRPTVPCRPKLSVMMERTWLPRAVWQMGNRCVALVNDLLGIGVTISKGPEAIDFGSR